jgi:RNA polymerase sigma-70 factor (ECF subfamily)
VDDLSDALIVAGLRRADPGAFDRAYERYHPRVFAFLLRLSGRREVADDLVQETWIKLARHATTLREDTQLAAYLFTIARNAYRSFRRWAWLDATRVDAYSEETPMIDAATPETEVEGRRRHAVLERAMAALSAADREVLLLVGVEGMAQDQAAIVLGIEHAAMRKRVTRARDRLAAKMEELEST